MIKTVKIGEIETKITDEIKKTDELKVLLRFGWGAEMIGKLAFNPAEDLKAGDEVRVIVEKIYEEPEPEEEKEAAAGDATGASEAEGKEGAPMNIITEPIQVKGEEGADAVEEVSAPLKAESEGEGNAGKI